MYTNVHFSYHFHIIFIFLYVCEISKAVFRGNIEYLFFFFLIVKIRISLERKNKRETCWKMCSVFRPKVLSSVKYFQHHGTVKKQSEKQFWRICSGFKTNFYVFMSFYCFNIVAFCCFIYIYITSRVNI